MLSSASPGGQPDPGQLGAGGGEIPQQGELAADRAGWGDPGPAGDEGHPVPALPGVALGAAQVGHAVVAEQARVLVAAAGRGRDALGAVVAGEDQQRVFRQPLLVEGGHDFPDHPVDFADEIAVQARPAAADESLVGDDRRVRRGQRQVEEEGVGAGRGDVVAGAADELRDHLFQLPARLHGTGQAEHLLGLLRGRSRGQPVLLEPGVGREVGHVDAEVMVETAGQGTAADGLVVVDVALQGQALFPVVLADGNVSAGRSAVPGRPFPAEVPLADAGGGGSPAGEGALQRSGGRARSGADPRATGRCFLSGVRQQ